MKRLVCVVSLALLIGGCGTPRTKVVSSNETLAATEAMLGSYQERSQLAGASSVLVEEALVSGDVGKGREYNNVVQAVSDIPTPVQIEAIRDPEERMKVLTDVIEKERAVYRDTIGRLKEMEKNNISLLNENTELQLDIEKQKEILNSPWASIKHGITIFIKRMMWWLLGGSFLYLGLMVFASSNPIVGAIFSVVSKIVGAIIKGVAAFVPGLFSHMNLVKQDLYDARHSVLSKIVDEVATLGDDQNIMALKAALAKRLDGADKKIITDIKSDLGWK